MKACWRLEHCFQMAHSCSWKLVSVLAGWPQFLPQYGLVTWFLSITAWQSSSPEQAIPEREADTHTQERWDGSGSSFWANFRKHISSILLYAIPWKCIMDCSPHWKDGQLDSTFWRNKCQRSCKCVLKPSQPLRTPTLSRSILREPSEMCFISMGLQPLKSPRQMASAGRCKIGAVSCQAPAALTVQCL